MKKLFSAIIIITTLFFSCSTGKLEPSNKNLELAKKSFRAFNQHDWQAHALFFSDSCKYLDPSYGTSYNNVSRKNKAEKYAEMERMSPDIVDSISNIFGSGDKVVIQFVSKGTAKTAKGNFSWRLPICCVFTFKDGLVVCDETYYDRGA